MTPNTACLTDATRFPYAKGFDLNLIEGIEPKILKIGAVTLAPRTETALRGRPPCRRRLCRVRAAGNLETLFIAGGPEDFRRRAVRGRRRRSMIGRTRIGGVTAKHAGPQQGGFSFCRITCITAHGKSKSNLQDRPELRRRLEYCGGVPGRRAPGNRRLDQQSRCR